MEEKKIVETLFVRRSVNVSEQDIDDILCTAFEGGITYWCDSVRVVGNYLGKYASDQISRGGKLKFHVEEPFDNEETEWYEMDQEKFLHGLQEWLNCSRNSSCGLYENKIDCSQIDAPMADEIIQYTLFDEIIFG